ncbi:MAG: heme biosynthesis protein HemY [Bdellovibrionales bacterium RIFOXYD1_FULL_44_7]|nr:MAG: heme biosynthesis protein HemY [Bdellovibrionales bacterium RIFOXYD1_FULL_44_7]
MINLTEKAIAAIKRFQGLEPANAQSILRIRVVPGGCSGMNYQLDFDNQQPAVGDKVFEKDGVKVVVDPRSFIYLSGIEIDYKDGLSGSGFIFNNPNAKETCKCGESFSN